MHAEPTAISKNTAGSPASRTKCEVSVTTDSVTEARISTAPKISSAAMRVWVDLTNSPHVLVMRPIVERLREDGHEVRVTARDFAQTLGLLRRFEIPHTAIGRHRGERLVAKAGGLALRSIALARWALADARGSGTRPPRPFDIALGHGSNDVSVAAAALRIPSATMFDYEWAAVQHHVNCRLARTVVVPDAIPPERLQRYGAQGKLRPYAGLKEEYYLADFEPDPTILAELALDPQRPIVLVRTPPEVALYHRFGNDLFAAVLERLRAAAAPAGEGIQPVLLPRTPAQRDALRAVPGFIVPVEAIDAQSLIVYADLVISAGGTMNREAVALGTPVYSTFEGRLGAVDERLIEDGRLRKLRDPSELDLSKQPGGALTRIRRDPRTLVDLLLSAQ
jgi:predicted glycosyltransferase